MSTIQAESWSGIDLSLLPNSLRIHVNDDQVNVSLLEHHDVSENKSAAEHTATIQKKPLENEEETILTTGSDVPESVLRYQRQLRKVHANQRSIAQLSMESDLKIVYEDSHLIVVNKPPGVLCVPGLHDKPNLLQLVCQHIDGDGSSEARSDMIVHRLDMDTSGLVVFSKTRTALTTLQSTFRDRRVVVKEYHALLCGHLPDEWKFGNIHLPLQRDHRHPPFMRVATPRSEVEAHRAVQDLQSHGFRKLVKKKPKPSHTEFFILAREYLDLPVDGMCAKDSLQSRPVSIVDHDTTCTGLRVPVTRVMLTPHTGRTHQLRVHCAAIGFPIVGDQSYGLYGEAQARGGLDPYGSGSSLLLGASMDLQKQLNAYRPLHQNTMCLHAAKLGLNHPTTGEPMIWTAPTPF